LDVHFPRIPLDEVLARIAELAGLALTLDSGAVDGFEVRMERVSATVRELLDRLESTYPIRIVRERGALFVRPRRPSDGFALLLYPLPAGLVERHRRLEFDALRQLSFVSRSQDASSGVEPRARSSIERAGEGRVPADPTVPGSSSRAAHPESAHHLDHFLTSLSSLVAWPDGSTWFLDERRNVLLVRSSPEVLDQVETLLESVTQEPVQIHVEARFVELSEDESRDLGVEFGLRSNYGVAEARGGRRVELTDGSRTRFGGPLTNELEGLRLAFIGVLTEPEFSSVLHAIEVEGRGEVLSAPSVTTVNNSRATIAITTNLPFVEGYRPVVDRELVASEGISRSEQSVALVAQINDENYTGIVLDVTPSVGSRSETIQLRLQPVVRDRVGEISISEGALVEGVPTPAIARPIIETRFLDTQTAIRNGETVVLGGLKKAVTREETTGVPILRHIPLLGRMFEREVTRRERRDLLIFITARRTP
ncbi:MAG: hypothetical protein AAF488_05420, partial [Planctomycetota bacterium]